MRFKSGVMIALLGSVSLLGACATSETTTETDAQTGDTGTTEPSTNETAIAVKNTFAPDDVTVSFDDSTGQINLTLDGEDINLSKMTTTPNGDVAFYSAPSSGGNVDGIIAVAAGNADSVFAIANSNVQADPGAGGAYYARLVNTDIPNTGNAVFTGPYGGLINRNYEGEADREVTGVITGTTTLNVDFENASMDGAITNRRATNYRSGDAIASWTNIQDLSIVNGTIDENGKFSAGTTGGDLGGLLYYSAADGTAQGLITGATGDGAVGLVDLTHSGGNSSFMIYYRETGGFVVDE